MVALVAASDALVVAVVALLAALVALEAALVSDVAALVSARFCISFRSCAAAVLATSAAACSCLSSRLCRYLQQWLK